MSNRIDATLQTLKKLGKKAFVSYSTAFDPDRDTSLEVLRTLADCGVDIIELGIPFSDPMADGVINQMAAERALAAGATVSGALDIVKSFRETHPNVPVVVYTYLNPVYAMGYERFQREALAAGVDAVLLVDVTADEAALNPELKGLEGMHHIQLASPLTPGERKKIIGEKAQGFIYMLSRAGVTGGHSSPSETIPEQVSDMRKYTDLPIIVGFGISTVEMAVDVAGVSDGVVIGSAIVKIVEEYGASSELRKKLEEFVTPLTQAVHSV